MENPFLFFNLPGVPPHVTYTWFIMLLPAALSFLATRRLDLYPTMFQNVVEFTLSELENFLVNTMGPTGKKFFPLIATLALFILTLNLIGIIPGFDSPTNNLNTTAAMAIVVFLMTHIIGIKVNGLKYLKQFTGPIWWMTPIMLPIELISHLARPLSLSMRLFGNIMGEDIVLAVVFLLVPLLVPLPVFVFMIFTSLIQTLVFTLLAMMYIAGAMEEGH